MTAAHAITIEIGGTAVRMHTRSASFAALLQAHYAKFVSAAEARVELQAELMQSGGSKNHDLRVSNLGGVWHFRRGDFRAEYVPAQNRGCVRLRPTPYAMDSVLRILHTLLLARERGFLLHAASAIGRRGAWLFSGTSGAGKTTIARLAPPTVTLLTDEISYVRRNGTGYHAFGTPFSGELAEVGENTSARLSIVYLLVKGQRDQVQDIAPAKAARAIMRNVLFFAADPELINNVLASVCDLVSRVPVRQLTFAPTPRVWELLQQEGG